MLNLYNLIMNNMFYIIIWAILAIVLFLVYNKYMPKPSIKISIISSIVVGLIFSFSFLTAYPLELIATVLNTIYPVRGYDPAYVFIYFSFFSFIISFPFSLIIYYIYDIKIAIKMGILTFLILYFASIIILLPAG